MNDDPREIRVRIEIRSLGGEALFIEEPVVLPRGGALTYGPAKWGMLIEGRVPHEFEGSLTMTWLEDDDG